MATINYEVSAYRKADGTRLVKARVTDIYLARDWSRVWEANRKVLDLVFGVC